jgi:phage-related protein (TIGR01555 family)
VSTQSTSKKPYISAGQFTAWQKERSKSREAMDMFSNSLARTGFGTPNLLESTTYPLTRLTKLYWLLQSLYRNHWLVRKVIDAIAEDEVKNWVSLTTELPPATLDKFTLAVDNTQTVNQILTALKWGRLFGGAGALIVIEGDDDRLDEPLKPEDVMPGTYKGLIPFDRWSGISPASEISTDINDPHRYGLPEYYRVTPQHGEGFRIHSSRILRFIGRDLPYWEKQAEQYWGISEVEVFYEELKKRDNTSWNIAMLVFRANIFTLRQKDLAQMLSGLSMSTANQMRWDAAMEAMNRTMSNQGLLIVPEEGGVEAHSYAFSGIADVYMHFKEDICAATGYPYSRLFGKPSGGLGTTNEGDEATYYDSIAQKQRSELDPQLKALLPIVAMSTWGKIPKDFNWVYKPVRSLNDETRTKLATETTNSVVGLFNAGIWSRKQALLELKQQSDVTLFGTNITGEDIEKASDETQSPMEMMTAEAELNPPGPENEEKPAKKAKDENPHVERRVELPYGLVAYIENEVGSLRTGRGWSVVMKHPYGYLAATRGRDGDAVDCFLGPDLSAPQVYAVHTAGNDREDKLMIGFASPEEAKSAFLENYSDPKFFDSMDTIALSDLPSKLSALRGKKLTAA